MRRMCYYSYAPRGARVKRFVRTAVISCLAHPLTVWGPQGNAGRSFATGVRTAHQGVGPSLVRRFSFPDASTDMRSSVPGTGRRRADLMDITKIHGTSMRPRVLPLRQRGGVYAGRTFGWKVKRGSARNLENPLHIIPKGAGLYSS